MFDFIRGVLTLKKAGSVVLDVGGLGYKIETPVSVVENLPIDQEVQLYTHMVVRDDKVALYGFISREQCDFFCSIIAVSGIGPKIALHILSTYSVPELVSLLEQQDIKSLMRVPNLGRKKVRLLIAELSERDLIPSQSIKSVRIKEAEEALISLGYSKSEATKAVDAINDESLSTAELVKQALKNLASHK